MLFFKSKNTVQSVFNTSTPSSLSLKIGGEAGMGIISMGQLFAKVCARHGLNVIGYGEYPSLIKGGHNTYSVRVSTEPIYAQNLSYDLLIALNKETILLHKDELRENGGIVFDSTNNIVSNNDIGRASIKLFPVPLKELASELSYDYQIINTVALGALFGLVNLDFNSLSSAISDFFSSKGKDLIDVNIQAAKRGFDFVTTTFANQFGLNLEKKLPAEPKLVLTGNEALAIGAIKAGCKFYAAYPMTPTSSILHYLIAKAQDADMVVIQGEDEIGVVNMAIGASFAGVRSMVATAGGGFSLMVEALGLAAMTETPLVIVVGQRPGPATGLPTWTSQADLRFVLSAAQDDFPRIVIAPGDIEECFYFIAEAFNIAEKFQTPIIVLTDKYLAESSFSTPIFDQNLIKIDRGKLLSNEQLATISEYKRYQLTEDGVSPRALPGQKNGQFVANSDEHDEFGFSTEEAAIRKAMMEKRMIKLSQIEKVIQLPKIYGPEDADLTLICWGSNKGVCLEVMNLASRHNIKLNLLHIVFLNPFSSEFVKTVLERSKISIIIENNFTGHLESLIMEKTGLSPTYNLRKFDGRPFYPEEIYAKVKQVLNR